MHGFVTVAGIISTGVVSFRMVVIGSQLATLRRRRMLVGVMLVALGAVLQCGMVVAATAAIARDVGMDGDAR